VQTSDPRGFDPRVKLGFGRQDFRSPRRCSGNFFDPIYCLNRNRYRPGTLHDIELAAIAYSLKVVPRGTKVRMAVGDALLDRAAVLFPANAKGKDQQLPIGDEHAYGVAYIFQPAGRWQSDDYEFCAPVKSVDKSELDGIPVWKFRATVMRVYDGQEDVDLDIYATGQAIAEPGLPQAGDEIAGKLWLQGTLG